MEELVKEGANVNEIGKDGITPLFFCILGKKYEGFEKLLELGANPNYVVKDRNFAILDACIYQ